MTGKQPRIVILGAGPAGLMTAHYLRQNGYRDVIVLEKLGRVGGLASSITWDGRTFDLGANYITPAYREIRKLAKTLGAETYAERPFIALRLPDPPASRATLGSIVAAMRVDEQGRTIPMARFAWANLRYIWKRFRLAAILDRPTFAGVEAHPELTVPMQEWLRDNQLLDLRGVFLLPVNLMGFGTVDTTPALYPLKFMTLKTYLPMLIKETPFIGRFSAWPRRFTDGFQRLFDRLSWQLNVRLGVDVTAIRRDQSGVHVTFRQQQQILNQTRWHDGTLVADHLILACPLTKDSIGAFLDVDPASGEGRLLSQITSLSYCMTTHHVGGPGFAGKDPLAGCYPEPPMSEFLPWGVAKQWLDSDFTQFYTRVDSTDPDDVVQARVEAGVRAVVQMMDGEIKPERENWSTFNRWPYFQHVSGAAINDGWFTALERQQGVNRTYYVGGATNFELIEPIAAYAKNLVATHFPPIGQ